MASLPVLAFFGRAHAFERDIHIAILREALWFLRDSTLDDIINGNLDQDCDTWGCGWPSGDDEKHFDDCEFDGGAFYINTRLGIAIELLAPGGLAVPPYATNFDLWFSAYTFGELTHGAQDLYSHSNWVELGFPSNYDPNGFLLGAKQSDLYDLTGAPYSNLQDWFVPSGAELLNVRDDIILHNDDLVVSDSSWSVDIDGGGCHVPILYHNNAAAGRLLTSGRGSGDEECSIYAGSQGGVPTYIWEGFHHQGLHKDNPTRNQCGIDDHNRARVLATLQTSYEWCRLVYKAGLRGVDGLLLATWVTEDGVPHPPYTPCATTTPVDEQPVTVIVEGVRVRENGDDSSNQPGEVNLVLLAYNSPFNFRRSARCEVGPLSINRGDWVPMRLLPQPVTIDLAADDFVFSVALHGWDDDDDAADPFLGDLDNNDDDDEVLVGFQTLVATNSALRPEGHREVVISDAFEVTFRAIGGRVVRADGSFAGSGCAPAPTVTAGIERLGGAGGLVQIWGGSYSEALRIDRPTRLEAIGGPVFIGQ